MKDKAIALILVLFLTFTCISSKKNRKNKQHVPHIDCDIKAGKIVDPEFLAKCPPGCDGGKHRVYGTDIYASFSSICSAAIHSGIIDNNGGKILVRKVAGQSGYKGSFSNGIRSLSLPRWKESFVVAEGKGKKGVTYPSTLEYVEVKIETVQRIIQPPPTTQPTTIPTTTTPEPTTPEPTTTARPTTIPVVTTTTARTRPPILRPRDTGSSGIHPAYRSIVAAASRQVQAAQGGRGQNQAYRSPSTYPTNRQAPRVNAAVPRQDPSVSLRKPIGNLQPSSGQGYSRVQQILAEKSVSAQANQNFPRRDWQNPSQRVNVHTVQRRPTAPETINVAPPVAPSWPEERRETQVSNSRSSLSEVDRWVSGFSQSNPKTSESDTVWKVIPATPEPVVKEVEPSLWKGFSETAVIAKEDFNIRPAETVALGGINCKIDLVFLMDGSWSIGKRRFRIQKLFLSQMADALDVGLSGPLMGIVQYGDEPTTEFSLRSFFNSKDLKAAIDKISQKGGFSNVGKALSYVNKNYFLDTSGNRGGAPNVAVVLVDGWPTDKVEEASRLARESGINIFFVTIEGADDNERSSVVEPNFVDKAVCRTNGHYSMNVPSWFGLHKIVNPLVKRICETDKLVCSKTCLNAADIAFVIDGSSSVGTGNFRTVLQFIANITSEFEISDTDTRIGAVQYTYEQRLEFGFDKYSTKQDLVNAIMRIGYWSGGTSTGAAITYASQQLFSKSKPNKRKIMIVITDGRSYDDVRVPATTAHRNGVIAYAVGIAWAAHDELESIATDPDKDHSFFVDEFDSLYKFVPKIIQNICTEYNSQPRN
ncbi:vitrin isoform X1 [Pelobates cultripes]|uniref:Cochlin n=1 Tax=Pelobates cultripes TaxID=61616 RepID=A0AAD1RDB7_PELCU|nr:vitrin isoform X1 [Pelobates cultripes]